MFDRLQRHTVEIYNLRNKEYEILRVKARDLIRVDRFDLFAKLYYARCRQTDYASACNVYDEHIRAFNPDLKEPGRDDKNSVEDFRKTFDSLLDNFSKYEFDESQSLVPISENGTILDGAHRVVALAYHNKEVVCVKFQDVIPKAVFNYDYFMSRGLSWSVCDVMAMEMINWIPNIHIACLWPKMVNKSFAIDRLRDEFVVGYQVNQRVSMKSMMELTRKVYSGQPWVTDNASVESKAMSCFDFNGTITFVAFSADTLEHVLSIKESIRRKYRLDKHALHITDTVEEARDLSHLILTEDGLRTWQMDYGIKFKLLSAIEERWMYFKKVQLINIKVAIARIIGYCIR